MTAASSRELVWALSLTGSSDRQARLVIESATCHSPPRPHHALQSILELRVRDVSRLIAEDILILSLRLRSIHRPVSIPDHIFRPFVQIGTQRNPDARPDQNGLGDADRVGGIDHMVDQQSKLIAAVAAYKVAFSHTGLEPFGRMPQHGIARLVPEAVVDGFESVQIDEEDGKLSILVGAIALDGSRYLL